jgi:hypothetical protein
MCTVGELGISLALVGLTGIGFFGNDSPSWAIDKDGKLTLTLSRKRTSDEAIVLRLSVGVLPRGAHVAVRTLDGEIAGSVVPFGVRPGVKAGVYTIPIPAKAIARDTVTLRVDVMEKNVTAARAPARSEIEKATLAFIPVTGRDGKGSKKRDGPGSYEGNTRRILA